MSLPRGVRDRSFVAHEPVHGIQDRSATRFAAKVAGGVLTMMIHCR